MNINLGIAFKILWILNAIVTKTLNYQCISFSIAPTFPYVDKPFRKWRTLMITFYLKVKCNQFKLICMEIKTILGALTGLSLIRLLNTQYQMKNSVKCLFLIKVFCKKAVLKTHSWDYRTCIISFFFCLGMLICTAPDDSLIYILGLICFHFMSILCHCKCVYICIEKIKLVYYHTCLWHLK